MAKPLWRRLAIDVVDDMHLHDVLPPSGTVYRIDRNIRIRELAET